MPRIDSRDPFDRLLDETLAGVRRREAGDA